MANKAKGIIGQKGFAKSPSGIDNSEHCDMSGSKKIIDTTSGAVQEIFADADEHAGKAGQLVRFTNIANTVAFVFIGEAGEDPAPSVTNALAIPPNGVLTVVLPELVSGKSPAFKCSAATVQAVVFEQ